MFKNTRIEICFFSLFLSLSFLFESFSLLLFFCHISVFFAVYLLSRGFPTHTALNFTGLHSPFGDRVSTVVKVLCYKSEGRWFDPS